MKYLSSFVLALSPPRENSTGNLLNDCESGFKVRINYSKDDALRQIMWIIH